MSDTQLISEDRLIAVLAAQPVPIHVSREEDGLYHWKVEPTGSGTAQTFEEAFGQALTYALTPLRVPQKVRLLGPKPAEYQPMTLDERLAIPFNEVDPATWPIDGQWPDVL